MTLPLAIASAMPGTMAEVSRRIGVGGSLLWDTAKAMRAEGYLKREGKDANGKLIYHATGKPVPEDWEPYQRQEPEPRKPRKAERDRSEDAAARAGGAWRDPESEKKDRKRPVIVFYVPGWPNQDPDRRMVWRVASDGMTKAERDAKYLNRRLGHEAIFEVARMTPNEVYRMKSKGFSLKEQRERAERIRAEADVVTQRNE